MTIEAPQACRDCRFWRKDFGTWTVTGWTGIHADRGHCHLRPVKLAKSGDDFCGSFEARRGPSD